MDRQMIETLAAIAVASNAEDAIRPLSGVPDLQAESKEVFACGAVGHGLSSWLFRLVLRTSHVVFDVTLPCWRALEDESVRDLDARSIRTVCRLALAALGSDNFPPNGTRLEVSADERNVCDWRLVSSSNEEQLAGEGWNTLVDLLGQPSELQFGGEKILIIYP